MKEVTIGIPVRNNRDYLKNTLHSLFKNTALPFNLIIVDDVSNGQTKAYLRTLKNYTLISNERQMGFPHNINLIIDYSNTPYLVLLNSDTYVTKGWLNLLINCLESNSAHGIAGPSTSFAWSEQRIVDRPDWSPSQIEEFGRKTYENYGKRYKYLNILHNVIGFCYAFKRELVEIIGYFDEAYGLGQCEEIDYNTRAAKAGYKCVWVCGAYVHHYGGKSFNNRDTEKLLERNKRIYQNKFCYLQLHHLRDSYCSHCRGEESEYFSQPEDLKDVTRIDPCHTIEML